MSKHVTAEQIAQYRDKSMPPFDLLAFDRHVAQCPDCRSQLASADSVTALLTGLKDHAPQHLSYAQLADYVDAKSSDVDRELVESHVELCERCAAELGDLAAFAETMSATLEGEPYPVASRSKGLGSISFSKKTLQPKIVANEDKENKPR